MGTSTIKEIDQTQFARTISSTKVTRTALIVFQMRFAHASQLLTSRVSKSFRLLPCQNDVFAQGLFVHSFPGQQPTCNNLIVSLCVTFPPQSPVVCTVLVKQIDVQVRAGRVELTDINVNVSALAELLPQLSCRISSARIGKVRVEISYTKLLTESLAFFLDDVHVHIEPPDMEDSDKRPADREVGISTSKQQVEEGGAIMISTEGLPFNRENTVEPGAGHAEDANLSDGVGDESREGLDFLARWIDQITSKVKVMMHNIKVTVGEASRNDGEIRARNYGEDRARQRGTYPFLEVGCSFLRWCDETPDSPVFVAEGPQPSQGLKNWDGSGKRGKSPSDIHLSQKVNLLRSEKYAKQTSPTRVLFFVVYPPSR